MHHQQQAQIAWTNTAQWKDEGKYCDMDQGDCCTAMSVVYKALLHRTNE